MKTTKKQQYVLISAALSAWMIFSASSCCAAGKKAHFLKITFTRIGNRSGTPHWGMDVSRPFRYLVPEHQEKTDMGAAISECSQAEYLQALDKSLTQFCCSHPNAQIDEMMIGYFTVRELWARTRREMRSALLHVPGKKTTMHDAKNDNLNEPPQAARTAPYHVLRTSPTIEATRRIFLKHGFHITDVNVGTQFWFKEALNGYTWAKISTLPDAGIASPGTIEFVIATKGHHT